METEEQSKLLKLLKCDEAQGYTLAAIARHFDVHYSTVSRAVNGREQARVR